MQPRFPIAILVSLVMATSSPAVDDPEFNGRKMSDWLTMLKNDSLPRKRRAAVIALGQIAAENKDTQQRILTALAKALRSDASAPVRTQSAMVLGQQSPDLAGLFLSDLAEVIRIDKDSDVRRELAVALGRFGKASRPAVVPLVEVLKDPAATTRAAAAGALGRIGPDARQAVVAVLPLLNDPDRGVRHAAVFALGRLDPEDPEPVSTALIGVLATEQRRDRQLTANSAAGSVVVWATRRDEEMMLELVVALGLLGDRSPEVVQAVAGQLNDPSAEVRRQAGLSLAKFGPASRSASDALTKTFKADSDKVARIYSLNALRTTLGSDAKNLIPVMSDRLKADPDFEVRVAIAEELGSLGPAGLTAIPALREAQRDPQIKVREAATAAIRAIQKPVEKPKP